MVEFKHGPTGETFFGRFEDCRIELAYGDATARIVAQTGLGMSFFNISVEYTEDKQRKTQGAIATKDADEAIGKACQLLIQSQKGADEPRCDELESAFRNLVDS